MPNMNTSFNGATLIQPGAYEGDVPAPPSPNPNAVVPPLIVIGFGYGGAPATPYNFATVQAFQAFLRGGPATSIYAPVLESPSPGWNGAQEITYFNACESTQATATFAASATSSGACPIMEITSTNYGLPSNQMTLSATPVYNGAGVDLTLYDGYSGQTMTQSNVGIPLQVSYSGINDSGTIAVEDADGSGIPAQIVISDGTSVVATLPIGPAGYNLVSDLFNYLNGITDFSAIVLGDATLPLTDLDIGTYTIATATPEIITAGYNGPVYWINQYCGNYATAESNATSRPLAGTVKFVAVDGKQFTGATSIPPVLQDYADCFNAALNVAGWALITDSSEQAIRALASAHVTQASSTLYGQGRRYFTGSDLGDTVAVTAANCQALSNKLVVYAYPGISITDPTTGVTTMYGGYMAGAAAAAFACGNDVAQPLTNKPIQAVGVEVALELTDIDTLQQAGCMPIAVTDQTKVPRFVSDITTWQADNNPLNVFAQQVACRLWLGYSLVNATQPYVGTIASPFDEVNILKAAKKCLNGLIRNNTNNSNAVLVSWNTASLQLVYIGQNQQAAISVSVMLVGQNRFITILVPVQTYNGTSTIAST